MEAGLKKSPGLPVPRDRKVGEEKSEPRARRCPRRRAGLEEAAMQLALPWRRRADRKRLEYNGVLSGQRTGTSICRRSEPPKEAAREKGPRGDHWGDPRGVETWRGGGGAVGAGWARKGPKSDHIDCERQGGLWGPEVGCVRG